MFLRVQEIGPCRRDETPFHTCTFEYLGSRLRFSGERKQDGYLMPLPDQLPRDIANSSGVGAPLGKRNIDREENFQRRARENPFVRIRHFTLVYVCRIGQIMCKLRSQLHWPWTWCPEVSSHSKGFEISLDNKPKNSDPLDSPIAVTRIRMAGSKRAISSFWP